MSLVAALSPTTPTGTGETSLTGMSFWPSSHGLSIFREVLRIDQDYYPETLGEHFIINAPFIFTGTWALVKGWLDPVTAAKFHILGSDYQQVLRERIKPEHL